MDTENRTVTRAAGIRHPREVNRLVDMRVTGDQVPFMIPFGGKKRPRVLQDMQCRCVIYGTSG